jgi:hypothetical protein
MADIAGNVTIDISGNIAPFEAALAEAKQIAATFDAQITAQLNGTGVSEVWPRSRPVSSRPMHWSPS